MELPNSSQFCRVLRLLIALCACALIGLFLLSAHRRLHFPYELEELEGYMFLSVLRVFHGQTVFPRPSLDFIPYMYPPVFYYVCAALGKLMGMTIATLRTVSILSTLGAFGMIYLMVFREVRSHLSALAAAGLYAGCYTLSQEWFDLGRLDSLFILFVLLSMYATRHLHPLLAALAWTLTFQTKQSILPAAFLMLCFNFSRLRRTAVGLGALALGAGGSVAWLNYRTAGWYSFYVFQVPRANTDITSRGLLIFWPHLLQPLGVALLLILAAALLTQPCLRSPSTRFYLAACSLVPLFWWIEAHAGSASNAAMPIFALVAILFGISIARLSTRLPALVPGLHQPALALLLLAVLVQEVSGLYGPGDFVPSPPQQAAIETVIDQVHRLPGDIYVAEHPYYGWLAGKPVHADLVSLHDAMRVQRSPARQELQSEMHAALDQHRFSGILFDGPDAPTAIDAILGQATPPGHPLPDPSSWRSAFQVRTTLPEVPPGIRPDWLMARCLPQAGIPCNDAP